MLRKGDQVQHRLTKRVGIVLGESQSYPGWFKVQWESSSFWFRYEPEDLILIIPKL